MTRPGRTIPQVRRDGLPGNWTWPFPALCTHRHAWPLYSFGWALAGLQPTAAGIRFRPSLPPALGAWAYETPLMAARWDGAGLWTGHYAPAAAGEWVLEVDVSLVLAHSEQGQRIRVTLRATRGEAGCARGSAACEEIGEVQDVGAAGRVQLRSRVKAQTVEWSVMRLEEQ